VFFCFFCFCPSFLFCLFGYVFLLVRFLWLPVSLIPPWRTEHVLPYLLVLSLLFFAMCRGSQLISVASRSPLFAWQFCVLRWLRLFMSTCFCAGCLGTLSGFRVLVGLPAQPGDPLHRSFCFLIFFEVMPRSYPSSVLVILVAWPVAGLRFYLVFTPGHVWSVCCSVLDLVGELILFLIFVFFLMPDFLGGIFRSLAFLLRSLCSPLFYVSSLMCLLACTCPCSVSFVQYPHCLCSMVLWFCSILSWLL